MKAQSTRAGFLIISCHPGEMTVRRRVGEGTVHPVVLKGRVVSFRGLASYKDPVTGKQRRRSVSRKTRAEAERALAALLRPP